MSSRYAQQRSADHASAAPKMFKRSTEFGAGSSPALDKIPSYVTLPRNRARRNRSQSVVTEPSNISSPRTLPSSRSPWAVGSPAPATSGLIKSRSSTLYSANQVYSPSQGRTSQSSASVNRFGVRSTSVTVIPTAARRASLVHEGYSDIKQSTVAGKSINVCRVSREEVLQKRREREQSKLNSYQTTPFNKIQIKKQDLTAYVMFYEKVLSEKVEDNNLNIALEKRKKARMEGRLKYLLEDNENMSLKLLGLKQDLGAYLRSTETAV